MNYIDELARRIENEVPVGVLPEGDTTLLFRMYALLARSKGAAVDARDVHDAWAVWMTARDPAHDSIEPFESLDAATRAEDQPFVEAIRAVASPE